MLVTSSSVDGETEEVVVQLAECTSFCLNVSLTKVFLRSSRQAAVKKEYFEFDLSSKFKREILLLLASYK